ncbi:MAG: NADH-quinone oxidoreductase subunit NuoH [Phycisphaerales bacterium]|nr:NADH-quinone oxidoreductase subunit NuoH [Phycisphaerales bacterium]
MTDYLPKFLLDPQFLTSMVVILVVLHMLLGAAAYLIYMERKVVSYVQDRLGPTRVGPLGLLQPIADGLKLFFKEDFIPRGADKTLFILAPVLTVMPALVSFVVIPWAEPVDLSTIPFLNLTGTVAIAGANVNIGVVFLLATASLGVYGVTIGGWASNNKFSFLGGLRATAQMISYEIPMGVCLLCIILLAGSIHPTTIAEGQIHGMWNIIHHPIAAIIFYTCLLAEANRAPFDLAEAESELVGGWHTEYSSMKWALFFMGEYVNLCVGSAFFAILFLGGWSVNPLPWGPDLTGDGVWWLMPAQAIVMATKIFLLVFLTMMIRWTLPRFRFDQLMRLAWEGMIPASLLVLMITSVMVYLGWTDWMWIGSLAALAVIYVVYPYIPRQSNPNHRIPIIGSRFSPLRTTDA